MTTSYVRLEWNVSQFFETFFVFSKLFRGVEVIREDYLPPPPRPGVVSRRIESNRGT